MQEDRQEGIFEMLSKIRQVLLGMGTARVSTIDQEVASAFAHIPEVESVCVLHRDGDLLRVFTIVNEEDKTVFDQIYDREIDLEDRLASVRFDFNTITRRNRPLQEFLGQNTPTWEREPRRAEPSLQAS